MLGKHASSPCPKMVIVLTSAFTLTALGLGIENAIGLLTIFKTSIPSMEVKWPISWGSQERLSRPNA